VGVGKLRIRTAGDPDLDRVLELWAAARSPHARTADTPEVLGVLLARDPDSVLVAEVDGRIIGAVIAAFDGWRGNMYRLAVEPGRRREGIGRALIGEGERRLRALGARRITVLVGGSDDLARAFWEATGYEHDPQVARYVRNV
jgi:ribosomal protein S18 acetylase RimI-like enzyme